MSDSNKDIENNEELLSNEVGDNADGADAKLSGNKESDKATKRHGALRKSRAKKEDSEKSSDENDAPEAPKKKNSRKRRGKSSSSGDANHDDNGDNGFLGMFGDEMPIDDLYVEFNSEHWPKKLMALPVYGRPLLPSQIMPLQVGSYWSKMIEAVLSSPDKMLAILSLPMDRENSEIEPEDYNNVFSVCRIIQCRSGEDIQFVVQALGRARLEPAPRNRNGVPCKATYLEAKIPAPGSDEAMKAKALSMLLINTLKEVVGCNQMYYEELKQYVGRFDPSNPSLLADCAASVTNGSYDELNAILNTVDVIPRLELSLKVVLNELNVARIQAQIKEKVGQNINEKQREAILREQLREIKNELGLSEAQDSSADVEKYRERMSKVHPSAEVMERFNKELSRLQVLDVSSSEYSVARDLLECMTTMPWGVYSGEGANIKDAITVLEEDHEGLKDVKECIVENLAVSVFNAKQDNESRSIGLLFVGPPGVGKTSIGRSVARALNRPFYRMSLGGISDESEIRGHRRTYVGAYPGKFVTALRTAKAMNPVIMLDEIDKLKCGGNGDPAAALLEVLDPEQNNSFSDHYLDMPLDLSGCFFICTANSLDTIPAPLRDRLEIIKLNGYLSDEKYRIAKKYLLPKVIKQAGITSKKVVISEEVMRRIIEGYAREAGVRNLERQLQKIVRKCVVKLMTDEGLKSIAVKSNELVDYLGVAPFDNDFILSGVGIATGLAWNSVGGCALPIEAEIINRNAKNASVQVTGNLGKVMKESVEIAFSYVRSQFKELAPEAYEKDPNVLNESLIHVHVPDGATEKDGPSAGITIASAILSMASQKVMRKGFAMTGEISLTGRVLPIGGLDEKVMGARRIGVTHIIVPRFNKSDVDNMLADVKAGVSFYYVDIYTDVAAILFGETEVKPSYVAPVVKVTTKTNTATANKTGTKTTKTTKTSSSDSKSESALEASEESVPKKPRVRKSRKEETGDTTSDK